jgi:hypothetical protein
MVMRTPLLLKLTLVNSIPYSMAGLGAEGWDSKASPSRLDAEPPNRIGRDPNAAGKSFDVVKFVTAKAAKTRKDRQGSGHCL